MDAAEILFAHQMPGSRHRDR